MFKEIGKMLGDLQIENDKLKETNEGLLSIQYKLADSNLKLRQTLTEIKEITTKMEYGNDFDYDFTWGEQILQKIREYEVKDESN